MEEAHKTPSGYGEIVGKRSNGNLCLLLEEPVGEIL